jgi:hypothetical protein
MMTLAPLAPDSARSRQIRAACLRRLERTRERSRRMGAVARAGRQMVAPVAALLGAAYILNIILIALQTLSQ